MNSRQVASTVFGHPSRTFSVKLWDGSKLPAYFNRAPGSVLVLHAPEALRSVRSRRFRNVAWPRPTSTSVIDLEGEPTALLEAVASWTGPPLLPSLRALASRLLDAVYADGDSPAGRSSSRRVEPNRISHSPKNTIIRAISIVCSSTRASPIPARTSRPVPETLRRRAALGQARARLSQARAPAGRAPARRGLRLGRPAPSRGSPPPRRGHGDHRQRDGASNSQRAHSDRNARPEHRRCWICSTTGAPKRSALSTERNSRASA